MLCALCLCSRGQWAGGDTWLTIHQPTSPLESLLEILHLWSRTKLVSKHSLHPSVPPHPQPMKTHLVPTFTLQKARKWSRQSSRTSRRNSKRTEAHLRRICTQRLMWRQLTVVETLRLSTMWAQGTECLMMHHFPTVAVTSRCLRECYLKSTCHHLHLPQATDSCLNIMHRGISSWIVEWRSLLTESKNRVPQVEHRVWQCTDEPFKDLRLQEYLPDKNCSG